MKKSLLIGALAGLLLLPIASIEMKQVNLGPPQTTDVTATTAEITGSNATTQSDAAGSFSLAVPTLTGPAVAQADECDRSNGNHPGMVLQCFLRWLLEVTDASTGF